MYICKYHTIATYIREFGKTTIRPNDKIAVVKITNRVAIGFIIKKGRLIKVSIPAQMVKNFVQA